MLSRTTIMGEGREAFVGGKLGGAMDTIEASIYWLE